MGLISKIRKWDKQRNEQAVFNRFRMSGLAKQCMTCKWFVYREEKPRNWVCRAPNERMKFKSNVCLGWERGGHPEMVALGRGR